MYKKTSLSFATFFANELSFVTFLKDDIEKMIFFVGDIAIFTKKTIVLNSIFLNLKGWGWG
jgi:hypothetical protein